MAPERLVTAARLKAENARLREALVVVETTEALQASNDELREFTERLRQTKVDLDERRRNIEMLTSPRQLKRAQDAEKEALEQAKVLADEKAEADANQIHDKVRLLVSEEREDQLRELSACVAVIERCAIAAEGGTATSLNIATAADAADAAFNVGVLALLDASAPKVLTLDSGGT